LTELFGRTVNPKTTSILMRLYDAAGKEITKELLRVDLGDYSELTLISIEKNVKAIVDRLNRLCIKWTDRNVPDTYIEGFTKSQTLLNSFGADKDPHFNNDIHRLAIEKHADLTSEGLIKANLSIKINISTYLTLVRQAYKSISQLQAFDLRDEETIANLLDDAIREGSSRGVLEQKIRVHFKRQLYERKFININGRNYDMIKYARTVARTRLRKVQSEAVKNTCEQYDNDLVEISDHGTKTEICLPYEGNIFSISGKHPVYPFLDTWPPFHPNCMHSAAPTSEIALGIREQYA